MINLKFRIEEAPDAKSFMVFATEQMSALIPDLVLELTIDDDVQAHVVDIPLPAGFGYSVMVATTTLDDMPFEAERFEDGVYWYKIKTTTDTTDIHGAGFLVFRTEDTDSKKEPYISSQKVQEIYARLFGEEYAQKAVEFQADLGKNGMARILGRMTNGKIKLLLEEKGIKIKTPKHEAFHVVFNYMTKPERQQALLTFAKQKVSYEKNKPIDKVTDLEAEEWMADAYGFTSIEKIIKGNKTIWGRFVDWVADFAHRAGMFKNEMEYLFWQIDRGQFRNRPIDFSKEMDRLSVEDLDESEIESAQGPRKKYNMQFLISRFGDSQTVERVANILGSRILGNSPIGENAPAGSNSFDDSVRLLQNYYSKERISGDDTLSDGRKLSSIKPKEILRIFNDSNLHDIRKIADYMLQNKDIFDALIEKILPGIDLDDLSIKKEGEDTISDDKSLADFRKKTNPYIKFALKRVPIRRYQKFGKNGIERVDGTVIGMADYNDLQYSILRAVEKIKMDSANILGDPITALKDVLVKEINRIGLDTKRGMALASFVDTFFGLDPNATSIATNLSNAIKNKNIERQKFISEFLNGMMSQFFSLREKTAIDFNVYGYGDDKTVRRVEFSGIDSSRFKNELKAAVQSTTTDSNDKVKDRIIKNLDKDYTIDEFGIKNKNGEYIIKRHSGEGIASKYVFVDSPKLNSEVRKLMNIIGLKNFNGAAFNYVMKDMTKDDFSMNLYFRGLIKDKLDNRTADYNLKEFFADSIIKMIFSVKHNNDFFAKVKEKLEKITPSGYEGNNVFADMGINAKEFFKEIQESSFGFKILNGYLHNVYAVNIKGDENGEVSNTKLTPYTVFKPADFYKFFEVLSEVKDFSSGSGGVSFFYRPDGKKEYVYGLSSSIFDTLGQTAQKVMNKINSERHNLNPDSLLYTIDTNGRPRPINMLLNTFGDYPFISMNGIKEIKGIKHGKLKKGTTTPNLGNLLTIGLNEFMHSVSKGVTRDSMSIMTTNLGDSGYMYVADYQFEPGESFIENVSRGDFKKASVRDSSLNKALYTVYGGLIREYEVSNRRWHNLLKTLFPDFDFNKFELEPHEQHHQINNFIKMMNNETYRAFETKIISSDMVMNFDYQVVDGRIQLGKATTGLMDPATGKPMVEIYNIQNALHFSNKYEIKGYNLETDFLESVRRPFGSEVTQLRREIFRDAYKNFVTMLNHNSVMVSFLFKNVPGLSNGKFRAYMSENKDDWNPVLETMFMGSHVTNASLNALWLGSFSQYAGYSTTDQSKRSKPFTTPGTTAGMTNIYKDPYGMDESIKIAIITDTKISGDGTMESVYNNGTNATDGIGWTNPLALEFINHSFGGQFGVLDKGMMKPITSYVNPHTGLALQLKQAEHPITYQMFSKSLSARRMMNDFLRATHPDLPQLFNEWYDSAGGGETGWKNAMKNSVQFIVDRRLQNNLVWQFVNASAVKTGAFRINRHNLETGFEDPTNIHTIDIDTSQIRNILNPYQDLNDNERMSPPTQMLAIMGIGVQNKERINRVDNAMKLIFTNGVGEVLNKLFDKGESAIRDLMLKAADGMDSMSAFAEMVANNNISLDLPMLSEKMQQIIANNLTKNGQRKKFAGIRANQAPGHILDIYELNGQIYMLDELERMGLASVNPDFTVQLAEGITKRKLKPMTNGKPAEVVVPFVYMKKFGVKPDETLNDIYLIHLTNGQIINVYGKKASQIREIVEKNYHLIDVENTPMMRALTGLAEKEALKQGGADEDAPEHFGSLGEIMAGHKALMDLKEKLKSEAIEKGFNSRGHILSKVGDYFNALEQSLNLFGVRIPTSNLGSGFHGRVVGFVNDMGNTVYTSELKNILDGSTYDINQLSIFTRFINDDFTMPADNTIQGLQNLVVNELMNVYSDLKNSNDIYVQLSLKRLKKLADKIEKKRTQYINDPATAANDYFINMLGADSIDSFANLSSAFSYLNHLTEQQVKQLIPWASNGIFKAMSGENSPIFMLGTYLNAAMDNEKELILGRLGISKDATNVVGAMVVSGLNQEEIADFFDNEHIRRIYHQAQLGYAIENSQFDFKPYVLVTQRIAMLKKNGIHELNAHEVESQYEELSRFISDDMVQTGYARKNADGVHEFNNDGYAADTKMGKDLVMKRNDLYKQMIEIQELNVLSQLKTYLEKGETLGRLSHVVTLRKGFKAESSDFEFYKGTLEEYLGMDIYRFVQGEKWTKEKHMNFFVLRNNDARFGDYKLRSAAMDMELSIMDLNFNLVEIVRALPQFNEYIKRLQQLDDFYNEHILFRSRSIKEWANEYLLSQEQTKWHSASQRQTFYNELGRFFLAVHFNNKYTKGFDLGLSSEMLSEKSILKDIKIGTPEGRTLFALQFPQFIMAMKTATSKDQLKVNGGRDYAQWFDIIQQNQFIDRLTITGNNEERGFLALQDSFNLGPDGIYKLKSEFQKLPPELQEMFEIYELIVNGFENHKGSIKDVMGLGVLEDVSSTFDEIKRQIKNPHSDFHKIWKKNFLKALPHAEGMSRYFSKKDYERNTEREIVQFSNPNKARSMFQKSLIGRLVERAPSVYQHEYLRTSRLGIPYDPYSDVTTTLEPIHGLTAGEIDALMTGETLSKDFVYGHSYVGTTWMTKDGKNTRKYYILPNGIIVYVASMSKYSVTFKVTDEQID